MARAAAQVALAAACVVLLLALARAARTEKFGTSYNSETPTRSYTPYTGAIPYGPWGTTPWAYAFDLEAPKDEYWYLPAEPGPLGAYHTFEQVL